MVLTVLAKVGVEGAIDLGLVLLFVGRNEENQRVRLKGSWVEPRLCSERAMVYANANLDSLQLPESGREGKRKVIEDV